jgi:hypothetical protein
MKVEVEKTDEELTQEATEISNQMVRKDLRDCREVLRSQRQYSVFFNALFYSIIPLIAAYIIFTLAFFGAKSMSDVSLETFMLAQLFVYMIGAIWAIFWGIDTWQKCFHAVEGDATFGWKSLMLHLREWGRGA